MKAFNNLFIVLFIIFAALQYNDPDPYVWMPIYLYGAILCYLANKNKYNPALYFIGIGVYFIYSVYLFADGTGVHSWLFDHNSENIAQTMKAEKPWIEETREFFGLWIIIAVLSLNMIWFSRKRRAEALKRSSIWI